MTDYANATWIGSPNYSPNRDGHNPNWTADDPSTWIVDHTTVCCEQAARDRFLTAAQQASPTYLVRLDGGVEQFVAERDAPWTNGSYANNPGSNLDSITIEHEDCGDYNGPRTAALYEASAQLHADIHRRRGIPLVHRGAGGGVLRHKECNGASTACPDGLDIDRIIARANEILNPPAPKPPPPPAPDTRPEWQRNLKQLASVRTFALYDDVRVLDLANGSQRGMVAKATNLQVAYETSVGSLAYWVTTFGSTHGDGLLKDEVAKAVVPPPVPVPPAPPAPQPAPAPPADLWPWLQRLLDYLRKTFGGGGQ